ncbi:MAG TPA: FIST N-terminal domain-containing protein [Acidimicrobiales bacterium]|nr:FIST N-terminal domain-containing protein [Acidimicrobiales bacterium]
MSAARAAENGRYSFAAALSEHPVTADAVGEVVGEVLERLNPTASGGSLPPPPDLALLFVTPAHMNNVGAAAAAVRAALEPRTLLGCAAVSIVGGGREVERGPGVSLWAGYTGALTPFHLTVAATPDGQTFTGWPDDIPEDPSALLLLADPFTFPADQLLVRLGEDRPGLPVVGGLASAARGPGDNRLILDGEVLAQGAVGVFLGPEVTVSTVVSQGCRPVGNPFVVTKADRNVVYELAGRPALERLQEVAEALSEEDRALMSDLVQLGQVIDEGKAEFSRGDFLIRNVVGADPASGALAIAGEVDVGSTTQFQVRDADSADEDLRQLVDGQSADGALLFTCNGRGIRLFGSPNHDAGVVSESLAGAPIAGMFCAGELGPIGGHNFLHGFTASVVLLSVDTENVPTAGNRLI